MSIHLEYSTTAKCRPEHIWTKFEALDQWAWWNKVISRARWIEGAEDLNRFERPSSSTCLLDVEDRPLVLFETEWIMRRVVDENPKVKFIAAVQPGRSARAVD